MKIGITGSKGFLGTHMRLFLHTKEIEYVEANREEFESADKLVDFVKQCDAIVHFAGLNRGSDEEIYETNVGLTSKLITVMLMANVKPHVLFASSSHIHDEAKKETAYAKSKIESTRLFEEWAESQEAFYTSLVIPNVFGERGKPFYNSVVSTFCHQLANDEEVQVNDGFVSMELIHAQKVCSIVYDYIEENPQKKWLDDMMNCTNEYDRDCMNLNPTHAYSSSKFICGSDVSLHHLKELLDEFKNAYDNHEVPFVGEDPCIRFKCFRINLFNTLRSYMSAERRALTLHTDDRGSLFEAAKCSSGGQTFVSTTKPGITRGNHYHTRKVERFLVLSGKAAIEMRNVLTDEILILIVDTSKQDEPTYVDMPTFCTHSIKNIGQTELLCMFWCNEVFNPEDPDTYYEEV